MSFIPRIYLDPKFFSGLAEHKTYSLSASISHYLGNVLRLKINDKVILFNNEDGEWLSEIEHSVKNKVSILIKERLRLPIISNGPTLLFAPLKRDATDLAVRMATELGVQIIQPVKTVRTNSQRIKIERLQTITIEAAEQSNRLTVPEVRMMTSLFEVCEDWPQDKLLLVALERCYERDIVTSNQSFYTGNEGILIGPEGGFEESEIKKLLSYPFVQPLSLGDLILKAETAIVAGLAKLFPYVKA